jgi:hypothetical protein
MMIIFIYSIREVGKYFLPKYSFLAMKTIEKDWENAQPISHFTKTTRYWTVTKTTSIFHGTTYQFVVKKLISYEQEKVQANISCVNSSPQG